MKRGKNDEVLFSRPGYTTIGDTYQGEHSTNQDPEKLQRHGYHNGKNSTPKEYRAWKANDNKKTVYFPSDQASSRPTLI